MEYKILNDIAFRVDVVPIPQPRQRTAVRNGIAMNYTSASHPVNVFKASLAQNAAQQLPGGPLTRPLHVGLTFVLPRPKSLTRESGGCMGRVPFTRKRGGDVDNLVKAVLDAMNQVAYNDDSQVYSLFCECFHAAEGEGPHTIVFIQERELVIPPEQEAPKRGRKRKKQDHLGEGQDQDPPALLREG